MKKIEKSQMLRKSFEINDGVGHGQGFTIAKTEYSTEGSQISVMGSVVAGTGQVGCSDYTVDYDWEFHGGGRY